MQPLILTRNQFISFTNFKFLVFSSYIAYKVATLQGMYELWTKPFNDTKKIVHFILLQLL